jgi:hypothetical protein
MGGLANRGQERMRQLMVSAKNNRESNKFVGGGKFSSCFGKYPDCPEDAKRFAERFEKGKSKQFKKEDAPSGCKNCPFFNW